MSEDFGDEETVILPAGAFKAHLSTARQNGLLDAMSYVQDTLLAQKKTMSEDLDRLSETIGIPIDKDSWIAGFASAMGVVLRVSYKTWQEIEEAHGHVVPSLEDRIKDVLDRQKTDDEFRNIVKSLGDELE